MEPRRDGGQAQPDYSGLQVVHHGPDAPQAVLLNSLPEAVPIELKHPSYYAQAPLIPYGKVADAPELSELHELSDVSKADEALGAPAPHKQPWWKRKRWIISAITVTGLIIVGAVVGAVVATRSDNNSNSSTPSPADSGNNNSNNNSPVFNGTTQRSACRDQVCPQILASASLGAWPPSSSATILLFARGVDNAIWYTSAAASALSPSWPTSSDSSSSSTTKWQSLASIAINDTTITAGGGGPYLSQPSALTWGNGTRASVFALSDPSHMVHTLKFVLSDDDDEKTHYRPGTWEVLGGFPASSPISACNLNGSRPDLWFADDTGVAHNFGVGAGFEEHWAAERNAPWARDIHFDGPGLAPGVPPGVVCRPYPFFHDLVVYGADDGAVRHTQYSKETGWTPPSNRGGKFVGEPVVVEVTGDRLDFFGIGEDRHMYHFTWTTGGGYTPLEDAGGSFQSVPSVAVTGSGSRVDVVALGTNDRLQHRVLQGLKWASEWEDLGVFGNSAPLLVNITNTQPEKVGVFVVGVNGEVNQTTWSASSELSWKALVWKGMGGNMTTEFYRS